MRLLLDTQIFLWLNLEQEKCSEKILRLCRQEVSKGFLVHGHASIRVAGGLRGDGLAGVIAPILQPLHQPAPLASIE